MLRSLAALGPRFLAANFPPVAADAFGLRPVPAPSIRAPLPFGSDLFRLRIFWALSVRARSLRSSSLFGSEPSSSGHFGQVFEFSAFRPGVAGLPHFVLIPDIPFLVVREPSMFMFIGTEQTQQNVPEADKA